MKSHIYVSVALICSLGLLFFRPSHEGSINDLLRYQILKKNNKLEKSPLVFEKTGLTGSKTTDLRTTADIDSTLSEFDFVERIEKTLLGLPAIEELKNFSAQELHHFNPLLIEAGKKLGKIAEVLTAYPQYKNKGLEFYQRCVQKVETFTAIKALCLLNFEKLGGVIDSEMDEKNLQRINTVAEFIRENK